MTSVGLSTDGLQICAGTESGTLTLLDIVSHTHETLLRSHKDCINSLSLLSDSSEGPRSLRFLTGSADGTMRLWELARPTSHGRETAPDGDCDVTAVYLDSGPPKGVEARPCDHFVCEQSYEFRCPEDSILSTAATADGRHIAAGFESSWVRIFDLEQSTIVQASSPARGQSEKRAFLDCRSSGSTAAVSSASRLRKTSRSCLCWTGAASSLSTTRRAATDRRNSCSCPATGPPRSSQ